MQFRSVKRGSFEYKKPYMVPVFLNRGLEFESRQGYQQSKLKTLNSV